jgi:hypothetical protein
MISTKEIIAMTPDKFSKKGKRMVSIINALNKYYAQKVMSNKRVTLPYKFGYLTLSRIKNYYKDDGTPTYFVDWGETNKLWKEDEEAKRNKTLVRKVVESNVRLLLKDSTYKHHSFYRFTPTRTNKRKLGLMANDIKFVKSLPIIMSDDSIQGRINKRVTYKQRNNG